MATLDDPDDVGKILVTARTAVVEGESIVERTRQDYSLDKPLDDDGPLTQAWKQQCDLSAEPPPSAMNATLTEMVGHIVAYEYAGRRVAVGLGLAKLREHYECFDPKDLPADEQNWAAFATKHLPLPPEQVAMLIGTVVHHGGILRCTKCGTRSKCECGCGVPYVGEHRWAMPVMAEPAKEHKAIDRAAAAIAANPEKSNRAIAAEIGVGLETVRRARKQSENAEANGSPDGSPEKRVGRDGRSYPVTSRAISPATVPPASEQLARGLVVDHLQDSPNDEPGQSGGAANG